MKKAKLIITGIMAIVIGTFGVQAEAQELSSVAAKADYSGMHGGIQFRHMKTVDINIQSQIDQARDAILKNGDLNMAVTRLDTVLKLDNTLTEAYFWRAYAKTEQKKYYEADKDYEEALMQEPDNPALYYYRGLNRMYDSTSQERSWAHWRASEVINCFNKALAIDNNYLEARIGIADFYLYSGNYKEAKKRYDELLVMLPNNSVLQSRSEEVNNILAKQEEQRRKDELRRKINN